MPSSAASEPRTWLPHIQHRRQRHLNSSTSNIPQQQLQQQLQSCVRDHPSVLIEIQGTPCCRARFIAANTFVELLSNPRSQIEFLVWRADRQAGGRHARLIKRASFMAAFKVIAALLLSCLLPGAHADTFFYLVRWAGHKRAAHPL